jgi:hypothetical protein
VERLLMAVLPLYLEVGDHEAAGRVSRQLDGRTTATMATPETPESRGRGRQPAFDVDVRPRRASGMVSIVEDAPAPKIRGPS